MDLTKSKNPNLLCTGDSPKNYIINVNLKSKGAPSTSMVAGLASKG